MTVQIQTARYVFYLDSRKTELSSTEHKIREERVAS